MPAISWSASLTIKLRRTSRERLLLYLHYMEINASSRICFGILLSVLYLGYAPSQAATVIEDFSSPVGYYFGDWNSANTATASNTLTVNSTNAGGLGFYGLNINASSETALSALVSSLPGNATGTFQIILSDDTNNGAGFTANQAMFTFSLVPATPTTETIAFSSAYYYFADTGTFSQTGISQASFNFANLTQVTIQGDFASSDALNFSLSNIQAVPEPSDYTLLAMGVVWILVLQRRRSNSFIS